MRRLALLATFLSACATVNSGQRAPSDDVWFTRTTTFFTLPIGSSIWYCAPPGGPGPARCVEATIDAPADAVASTEAPRAAQPVSSQAPTTPPPAASPEPVESLQTLSRSVAENALVSVSGLVRLCVGPVGTVAVGVTFGGAGDVRDVFVMPPHANTGATSCIIDAVRRAHVPPFAGRTYQLTYQFRPEP